MDRFTLSSPAARYRQPRCEHSRWTGARTRPLPAETRRPRHRRQWMGVVFKSGQKGYGWSEMDRQGVDDGREKLTALVGVEVRNAQKG